MKLYLILFKIKLYIKKKCSQIFIHVNFVYLNMHDSENVPKNFQAISTTMYKNFISNVPVHLTSRLKDLNKCTNKSLFTLGHIRAVIRANYYHFQAFFVITQ